MNNFETVKHMSQEEFSKWLCAIGADVWGYCKAEITEDNLNVNRIWLQSEHMEET